MMRRSLSVLVLALVAASPVKAVRFVQDAAPVQNNVQLVPETEIDRQVRALASQLRCPVCQGLSLQDSPSELSQEMRDVIRTQLESGETPEQVRQYFVGRYGEWILLEPTTEGFNLAVYVLPVLLVLAGAAMLIIVSRRWLAGEAAAPLDPRIDEDDPDLASWEEISSR